MIDNQGGSPAIIIPFTIPYPTSVGGIIVLLTTKKYGCQILFIS